MKRALAKQLDSALEMLFNLRTKDVIPTNEQIARYKEVYTILFDDKLLESGPNGDEITGKGLAFMKKGGYIAVWNKEMVKLAMPVVGVVIGVLLTWFLSQYKS
jgi:hypothetical protein